MGGKARTPVRGRLAGLIAGMAVAFGLGAAILCGSAVAGAESSDSDTSASSPSESSSEAATTSANRSEDRETGAAEPLRLSNADRDSGGDAARDDVDPFGSKLADDQDDDAAHDELDASDESDASDEGGDFVDDADALHAEPSDDAVGDPVRDDLTNELEAGSEATASDVPGARYSAPQTPTPVPSGRSSASAAPKHFATTVSEPATTPSLAVSFSGVQLMQVGSATATTTGLGSWAIAWGNNATASANGGVFNSAWAIGSDSVATVNTATVGGTATGSFNIAFALGSGIAGVNNAATGAGATATAAGNFNHAWAFRGGTALVNGARADGVGAIATAAGSFNTAASLQGAALVNDVVAQTLTGTAVGSATGSFNQVWAHGSNAQAQVNDVIVGATAGGAATATASGHSNTAVSVGNTLGTVNFAQSQAGPGQATALVSGSHNVARINTDVVGSATINGAVVADGASAVVDGSGNVAIGDGDGTVFVNILDELSAGSAGVAMGDHNVARYTGSDNTVEVNVSFSGGSVGGNHNHVRVWGTNSKATAAGGNFNVAIALGDGAAATAEGSFNIAIAVGDSAKAAATGRAGNAARAVGNSAAAEAAAGDHNRAIAIGARSTAQSGGGDRNLARIVGSGGTAQAGFHGDRNIAFAVGDDNYVAAGFGNGNFAKLVGDHGYASAAAGNDNLALVTGDHSRAGAGGAIDGATDGNHNQAVIVGAGSTAAAGLGRDNTAIVLGNNGTADAGFGGDHTTVFVVGNLLGVAVDDSTAAEPPPPLSSPANPSPTEMTATPYGDIGKWMLQSDGQIADWLGQTYESKTMYEAINVIVLDSTSGTPEESVDRLHVALEEAGFLSRQIHSGGYQGIVDGALYSQQPTEELEAFSDAFFLLTNDHSRMFGPAPAAYGSGYVWITSASRETLGVRNESFTHVYVSFDEARAALRGALVASGAGTDLGLVAMHNKLDTATLTTGDHDGYAAVVNLN